VSGTAIVEGVCTPVGGYEEDYLAFLAQDTDENVGCCQLMERAGVGMLDQSTLQAFRYEKVDEETRFGGDLMWESGREEYRKSTGRTYPPLYRVRVEVKAERIPDDEAEKLWKAYAERYAPAQEG
jgi:hypothetical protein